MLADVAVSARSATGNAVPPIEVTVTGGLKAYADADMLRAALLNVTMNACQAAGSRDVDIRAAAEGRLCRITVNDRGPGISPGVRDRVFEPFFTTRAGGTGLGLAIVKRLLELQDGTVALHDRPDGGTSAEITIPLPPL
jgi:signal transduction histidine kinase